MAPPPKPARLWLRPQGFRGDGSSNGQPMWYIAHRGRRVSTGLLEHEEDRAREMLRAYEQGRRIGAGPAFAFVYFASANIEDYPIKIGWAAGSVFRRIAGLQMGNPHTLICLGTIPGGANEEQALHRQFAASHIRGEWFSRSVELLHLIATRCREAQAA